MGHIPPQIIPLPHIGGQIFHEHVAKGDCEAVRKYFDEVFWKNIGFVPAWAHLKAALENNDRPMMRLLITHGAIPDKKVSLPEDQILLLRRCGLPKDYTPAPAAAPVVQPGQIIDGEGVFVGTWTSKDLGKIFNVFAAPEDLTDIFERKILLTFNDAVVRVASLRDWHGHNGGNFENAAAVYDALKNGGYNGEWFIPTQEMLQDNLYKRQNEGSLKETFTTKDYGSGYPVWYWSSTEHRGHSSGSSGMQGVHFSDGREGWYLKDNNRSSCRPVRLVECRIS